MSYIAGLAVVILVGIGVVFGVVSLGRMNVDK